MSQEDVRRPRIIGRGARDPLPSASGATGGAGEARGATPIDPVHRADLETLRDLLRTAVELESRCDFGEPSTGSQPNRQAFMAHFTALHAPLEEWNAAVERSRTAPGALWEWFARAAGRRKITEPEFAVGSLIDRLAVLTLQRARKWQLQSPYELTLEHFRDRQDGDKYVSIHLDGQRVARLPMESGESTDQHFEAANRLIQGFFDEAQASEEAQAVADARDTLLQLKEELLERLKPGAGETPLERVQDCPVCARQA